MRPTARQLKRLVGNGAAYAVQKTDGSWYPIRQPLETEVLQRHLDKQDTVGTYVLAGDKARTLVFDLDEGEDGLEKAEGIRDELVRLGVPKRGIGIEFSGRKGYHVWVVFADFTLAANLRRIGRVVLGLTGLQCEVFPKQDSVRDLGNLIKLPCSLHQVTQKPNDFLGAFPSPISVQVLDKILESLPPEPERPKNYEGTDGVVPCIEAISTGVGSGSRNSALYHYAVLLRGSHRVPDAQVEMLVRDAAAKCDPPYGTAAGEDVELDQLLESSKHGGPICGQLPEDIRCDDCDCVKNQRGGLQVRPGQLKGAAAGEVAVVNVKERKDNIVVIGHPDIRAGGKVSVK